RTRASRTTGTSGHQARKWARSWTIRRTRFFTPRGGAMATRDPGDTLPADAFEMVAIDLDGTLLRSDGTIGAMTREAIAAAVQRGVKVVLASARPPRGTRPYYEKLRLDTLMINHNGALIFDAQRNRSLYHGTLDGKLAREAVLLAL